MYGLWVFAGDGDAEVAFLISFGFGGHGVFVFLRLVG